MLNPIIIAVMLTLPRYITDNYNYPAQKLPLDSLFILGLGGTPFMLYYWNQYGYTNYELTAGIVGSMFHAVAMTLLNYAVTYGLAGPSNAINQVQGIVHVILSCCIQHTFITYQQLGGTLLLFVGAVSMSLDWDTDKDTE